MLTVVVVLPTPPFWLITAMLFTGPFQPTACSDSRVTRQVRGACVRPDRTSRRQLVQQTVQTRQRQRPTEDERLSRLGADPSPEVSIPSLDPR